MKSRTIASLVYLALWLTACATAPAPTQTLTPITVQLAWTHQAQFAGMYVADRKGYYAAEGLAVTFVEGGSQVDKLASVLSSTSSGQASGIAQFGVAGADELILARAQGNPLCAIATIYRRSPIVFIALADTGITRPQDFAGKTIRAVAITVPSLRAMLARVGIGPDQYTIVDLPSDVTAFASGDIPVWSAYVTSFVLSIQQAGYKINLIYPDDYGVRFYSDTLYTTDHLMTADPDLVRRFLRATLQGWTYAIEHPGEMGPMVLQYKPDADAALENAKMAASLPLVNTGEDFIGWMKPDVWAGMEQTLREQSVITAPLDVTQVFTMRFLEEIYE